MSQILCACAVALGVSAVAWAQDTQVTSTTKVETDDASVVSLNGCLERNAAGIFTLRGTMIAGDNDLKTTTRVETDVDKDETRVEASSRTRVEDGRAVGTSGRIATFALMPREGVKLNDYIGHQVQIAAITVDPDSKDAEVKVEEKTTVDPQRGDSSTKRSKTEVEIEGGAHGQFTVVSVKSLASSCK